MGHRMVGEALNAEAGVAVDDVDACSEQAERQSKPRKGERLTNAPSMCEVIVH